MCQPEQKFKLCSCKDDPKFKTPRPMGGFWYAAGIQFIWQLHRTVEGKVSYIDGIVVPPKDQLNDQITDKFVLWQLNEVNCFDFDYEQVKGDTLTIRDAKDKFSYLVFSFVQGYWIKDFAAPTDTTELIEEGKVAFDATPLTKEEVTQMQLMSEKLPKLPQTKLTEKFKGQFFVPDTDKFAKFLPNSEEET